MPQYQHLDQTQFQYQQLQMFDIRYPASTDAFANTLDLFDPFQASASLSAPVPALSGSLAPGAQEAQGQVQQQQGCEGEPAQEAVHSRGIQRSNNINI